jgi:hypothetical protein
MNEQRRAEMFERMLKSYWANEWYIQHNPIDYQAIWDNEYIRIAMSRLIPQSHYDQINEMVYGIKRKL